MLTQASAFRLAGTLVLCGLLSPLTSSGALLAHEPRPEAVEEAIRRSLPILQSDGEAWLEGRIPIQGGQGCVSCHQVPFGIWGLEEAGRAGIVLDAARSADLARRAAEFIASPGTARAMSWGPLVLAASDSEQMIHAGFPAFALQAQGPDGHWDAKGQFPEQRRPLAETNAVATMWTMLALRSFGAPEAAADSSTDAITKTIERAYRSLTGREGGESTEYVLLRSLIEERLGQSAAGKDLLDRLLARQNADGGWSWLPNEESNALSTGQVLYRLSLVRPPRTPEQDRAVERATAYLVETQAEGGLWPVASVLTSEGAKPSKDYVYSYWGTAWATIGLARTRPPDDPIAPRRLSERMTISLVEAPLRVVASYFAARLGAELDLDTELLARPVTIELDHQSLRIGLDALCDQIRCAWRLDLSRRPPRLQFVRREAL